LNIDAAERGISERVESAWRKVEIGDCTPFAPVCDRDRDRLALIWRRESAKGIHEGYG